MKFKYVLVMLAMLFITCSKSPTKSSNIEYALNDLVGVWTGQASTSTNPIDLNLTVDQDGIVSGSGVSSDWSISVRGKVSGEGTYSFTANASLVVANGSWDLQLSDDKLTLTGEFDVSAPGLHNLEVTLKKS